MIITWIILKAAAAATPCCTSYKRMLLPWEEEPRPDRDQGKGKSQALGFGVSVPCFLPPKHLPASGGMKSVTSRCEART